MAKQILWWLMISIIIAILTFASLLIGWPGMLFLWLFIIFYTRWESGTWLWKWRP